MQPQTAPPVTNATPLATPPPEASDPMLVAKEQEVPSQPVAPKSPETKPTTSKVNPKPSAPPKNGVNAAIIATVIIVLALSAMAVYAFSKTTIARIFVSTKLKFTVMLSNTVKFLQNPGSVGVIPTDTVYGLVAKANDVDAVNRLYSLKSREKKPGTVLAASIEQLEELGLKRRYLKAVEQFWPGPVSVVLPVSSLELKYLHQGQMSLAVRIPDSKDLVDVLKLTGPLLSSSANEPGEPTAQNINEAKKYFGHKVDFYIDGGDCSDRKPSTIIRIIDDAVEVIRKGAFDVDEMLQ